MKCHSNPHSRSQADACGQTDRRTVGRGETNRRFSRLFAKAPETVDEYDKEPLIKSLSDHAEEKNTKQRIFNRDETSVSAVQTHNKVLAKGELTLILLMWRIG